MVKLYFSNELGMDSVDVYTLFRAFRKGGGTPMGGHEEPTTSEREGLMVLEFSGTARYREEEPDKLSIMAKSGVEEERGAISDCRGGEEIVEGELGGETEAWGRGGCHGDPLCDCPL
jgi:hypothetical protein